MFYRKMNPDCKIIFFSNFPNVSKENCTRECRCGPNIKWTKESIRNSGSPSFKTNIMFINTYNYFIGKIGEFYFTKAKLIPGTLGNVKCFTSRKSSCVQLYRFWDWIQKDVKNFKICKFYKSSQPCIIILPVHAGR